MKKQRRGWGEEGKRLGEVEKGGQWERRTFEGGKRRNYKGWQKRKKR